MNYQIIYILGINLLSFILMGWDKFCSINNYWRISENNLIGLSFLGGGIGILLGMTLFHHKTKKIKFQILIPLNILIDIILYIFFLNNLTFIKKVI